MEKKFTGSSLRQKAGYRLGSLQMVTDNSMSLGVVCHLQGRLVPSQETQGWSLNVESFSLLLLWSNQGCRNFCVLLQNIKE